MTLITDMAAALVALGYGTAMGTDIFAHDFPDLPHNAYAIIPINTGGEPDKSWESGGGINAIDYPGLQIQVRHTSKATAETRAETIRTGLDGAAVGDYLYCFTTRSAPTYLGADGSTPRYRFSIDFRLAKQR